MKTPKLPGGSREPETTKALAPASCSTARTLAIELAERIEAQQDGCEYRHVPTERLEAMLEKYFKERGLAQ